MTTYDHMKKINQPIEPLQTSLVSFTGEAKMTEGLVCLPVTIGATWNQRLQSVNFVQVDCPSIYNATLGLPTLNTMKAAVSILYITMKSPAHNGIGTKCDDQVTSLDTFYQGVTKHFDLKLGDTSGSPDNTKE